MFLYYLSVKGNNGVNILYLIVVCFVVKVFDMKGNKWFFYYCYG